MRWYGSPKLQNFEPDFERNYHNFAIQSSIIYNIYKYYLNIHFKDKIYGMDKKVLIKKNGPYVVTGNLPLLKQESIPDKNGEIAKWKVTEKFPQKKKYALCRCGKSKNKPYCDKNHNVTCFDGKETATNKKYLEQAENLSGPDLNLTDASDLCSGARFCDRSGGVWENVKNSDNQKAKNIAIESACNCPSGRLVVWDKNTEKPIEPELQKSIGILEDPQKKVSGPIWLKGGIDLQSESGTKYERRNRITLCRCGNSKNKPFCDSSHINAKFNDGDKSLE